MMPVMSMLRPLAIAVQFLTRLPTPRLTGSEPGDLARAAPFFPFVGAVIGALVAAAAMAGFAAGPWVGALAALLVWIGVTGGLHLDGLGDVADALGAAHGKAERFAEVLKDPHAGSFAVMAISLQIVTKLVLLSSVPPQALLPALVLVPAWARWGTLLWGWWLPSLTPGLGQSFAKGLKARDIGGWALVLVAASLWAAPATLAMLVLAPLVVVFWQRRIGGMSGDCHGASVEVCESLLLAALTLAAAF